VVARRFACAFLVQICCARAQVEKHFARERARGRQMRKQDAGFDFHRYRHLLAEAVDEKKRLALIDLLIEERAKERLDAQRASDRAAMTAMVIAKVLGTSKAGYGD
jgi:DNA invertase Pin-like site-specific DNA recombinase